MTGGLLQLNAYGSQNFLLNYKPQFSFFKSVYKTHSNFATESKRIEFSRTDVQLDTSTVLTCKIPRYGDLMTSMYLVVQLPDITLPPDGRRFRWVKHFGEMLVENYSIVNSGTLLDHQYGEWVHIWRQLTTDTSKIHIYNKMIGNTPDMYEPDFVRDNISTPPFIKGRTIVVPLDFWFNKDPGVAMPLVSLQYQDIYVNIELRKIVDLYTVDMLDGEGYRKPNALDPQHSLANFVNPKYMSTNSLAVYPYIEATYVYLDKVERNRFAVSSLDYLIEQHGRILKYAVRGAVTIDLVLQNPVKEIIFVLRSIKASSLNDWGNFVGDHREHLLESAKLLFNGQDRIEQKPVEYFSLIEPWQYHRGSPPDGVYVISFSLKPEEFQPSGACNMSRINKAQLYLVLKPEALCDVFVYTTNYNFYRVISGMGNIAFMS